MPPAPPPAKPAQPAADVAVAAQRQQTAVRDVLAQAQSLYNSGSADAAIQLLQDSLAGAERAQPPTPAATQLMLVRELARMELAQGRSAAVLELMTQVEPLLAGQPELWAVRANAAQRLGRHQDAVQFYGVALQSRPAEQRWLLGTAVSLSALGQLVAAADSAERARSLGPVSKEVWAYLRQQGVALPERP
jgi:tetratricopeptide (TPR) repeat protein